MNKIVEIQNEIYKVCMMDTLFIYLKNLNNDNSLVRIRSEFINL